MAPLGRFGEGFPQTVDYVLIAGFAWHAPNAFHPRQPTLPASPVPRDPFCRCVGAQKNASLFVRHSSSLEGREGCTFCTKRQSKVGGNGYILLQRNLEW